MTNWITIPVLPVPKPRQTRSDKWKKRPAVLRYRAFADELRLRKVDMPAFGAHIIFVMPMPKSWSQKRKCAMRGQPHESKPDKDNLEKAFLDAIHKEDSGVWDGQVTKLWGDTGKILIKTLPPGMGAEQYLQHLLGGVEL